MSDKHARSSYRKLVPAIGLAACLAVALALWAARALPAVAAPKPQPPSGALAGPPAQSQNEACLACHATPGLVKTLANGDVLNLTIDATHFAEGVHAQQGLTCLQCHTNVDPLTYRHQPLAAQSRREVTLQFYASCQGCHSEEYQKTLDSVHQRALASGNQQAAVCTDCHNPHTQTALKDPATGQLTTAARVQIPETCAQCHGAIYEQYKDSVHGSALLGEGNPDVPTCIDCHGVHNIQDPTTAAFRLKSPQLCAGCHTDPGRMDKYGLTTAVLSTYVADFHGTTVQIFEKQSPDQETNKPVCFDCHGFHDVRSVGDPQKGLQVKSNLLETCRKCHPDAQANFPDAWLGHYVPTPDRNPLVYFVQSFYSVFVPTVIGGMALYVGSDIVRTLINRRRKGAR